MLYVNFPQNNKEDRKFGPFVFISQVSIEVSKVFLE